MYDRMQEKELRYNPTSMKTSARFRFAAVGMALFCMLFMQIAMASYVCPALLTSGGGAPGAMSMGVGMDMADCANADHAQPTLCHVHADGGAAKLSLDNPELPPVPPFVPAQLTLTVQNIDLASFSAVMPPASLLPTRANAPPIAIRHCCFRI